MSDRWKLSPHAQQRAREMGLGRSDVLDVLQRPELDYPHAGRRVAVRGHLAVVHVDRVVVTVLPRRFDRWSRP